MGIIAAILAMLSIICVAVGFVDVLQLSSEPLISANVTWPFWMALAGFLMLSTIACLLLGRGRSSGE
jgi:hypothetical protein